MLQRLEETGFTINLEKTEFYKEELTFFGLRFTPQCISLTEDRVKAFKNAQHPEVAKALRSFLSSLTWSSRFMFNICTTAEPIWKLTKTEVELKWGAEEQAAFDALKRAMTTKCVGYFNKEWQSILTVYASPIYLTLSCNNTIPEIKLSATWCVASCVCSIRSRFRTLFYATLKLSDSDNKIYKQILFVKFTINIVEKSLFCLEYSWRENFLQVNLDESMINLSLISLNN